MRLKTHSCILSVLLLTLVALYYQTHVSAAEQPDPAAEQTRSVAPGNRKALLHAAAFGNLADVQAL